jgi:PadR family transcriptional regulator, regulatory protein AphA
MSSPSLSPIAYAILALVGERGAGAHELVRMMDQGRSVYLWHSPSQVYALPKRLAKEGYLRAHTEPGKTRTRTVYELTAKGRDALVDWLSQPAAFPRIQNEASLRLLSGDLLGDAAILASLEGVERDIARIEPIVTEMERQLDRVPHRARYIRLNHVLARKLLAAHREWLEEVRSELGGDSSEALR